MIVRLFSRISGASAGKGAFLGIRRRLRHSISAMEGKRDFKHALKLLDTLQSNRAIVSQVQASKDDMNKVSIPEMLEWVRNAGLAVQDLDKLNVIHVAGTKGKGSVCAMISSILQQYTGMPDRGDPASAVTSKVLGKVGLYTSPHLVTVRERIRINGAPISETQFARHFFKLWDNYTAVASADGRNDPAGPATKPGYFRYLTVMALQVFLQENVDAVVLECGVGGEYDCTNILSSQAVRCTAITKLGIDHVGLLGDTIEQIAWHKAGIMREGVECFTVAQTEEAMKVLQTRAAEKGAALKVVSRRSDIARGDVRLGLEGDFQKDNASLAASVASAFLSKLGLLQPMDNSELPAQFVAGLAQSRWEGRCEVREETNITWCIDGAHTIDSLEVAAEWFATKVQESEGRRQVVLIFNQQDRQARPLLQTLHGRLAAVTGSSRVFTSAIFCTNLPNSAAKVDSSVSNDANLQVQLEMSKAWKEIQPDSNVLVYATIQDAVEYARTISKEQSKLLVLVTGSLHLVGGLLQVIENV